MLLLTDGVTEAFSATGSLFGSERLAIMLKERGNNDPHAVIEAVTGEVVRFSAGAEQSDDITGLAVQLRNCRLST